MELKHVRPRWQFFLLYLVLYLCWLTASLPILTKYIFHLTPIVLTLGAVLLAAALFALRRINAHSTQLHWAWFLAFWILLTALYIFLYPIAHSHLLGIGSDSEDALRIGATGLLHLHFPYLQHTYLGNPITPMPGALLLATPFLLLGRVSLQNSIWLAAFIYFCMHYFRHRATALAYLCLMLLAAPVVLDSFVIGADYAVNILYLCVALWLYITTAEHRVNPWPHIAAGILLGLALSSRVISIVFVPLLLAWFLQRRGNFIAALRSIALPILTAAAATLPFYFYDAAHFTPWQVAEHKLIALPPAAQHLALFALPALALLIASLGFFIRLTLPRVFLLAGLAMAAILIPPALPSILRAHGTAYNHAHALGPQHFLLLSYTTAACLLIALWAFARFEQTPE